MFFFSANGTSVNLLVKYLLVRSYIYTLYLQNIKCGNVIFNLKSNKLIKTAGNVKKKNFHPSLPTLSLSSFPFSIFPLFLHGFSSWIRSSSSLTLPTSWYGPCDWERSIWSYVDTQSSRFSPWCMREGRWEME